MLCALTCIRQRGSPKENKLTRSNLGTLVPIDLANLLPRPVRLVLPGPVGSGHSS